MTFADGPDDQGLAASHVAGGKDFGAAGLVVVGVGRNITALVGFYGEGVQHLPHGRGKAHGQQDQIGWEGHFGASDRVHAHAACRWIGFPFHAHGAQFFDMAVFALQLDGVDGPVALAAFLVRGGGTQLHGPVGPGQFRVFLLGRAGHQFKLGDGFCALSCAGADAVRAGIATTNDHHMLSLGTDGRCAARTGHLLVLDAQKVHGRMHTLQLAAGCVQQARGFRAACQDNGIKSLFQFGG